MTEQTQTTRQVIESSIASFKAAGIPTTSLDAMLAQHVHVEYMAGVAAELGPVLDKLNIDGLVMAKNANGWSCTRANVASKLADGTVAVNGNKVIIERSNGELVYGGNTYASGRKLADHEGIDLKGASWRAVMTNKAHGYTVVPATV